MAMQKGCRKDRARSHFSNGLIEDLHEIHGGGFAKRDAVDLI